MIVQRALAVISAAMLVSAVAIATFTSGTLTLGQVLHLAERDLMAVVTAWSDRVLGTWASTSLLQPLLVRPAWLLPASLGIISAGLAFSLSNRKPARRSHRRS